MHARRTRVSLVGLAVMIGASPAAAEAPASIVADVVYGHRDGMALTFDVLRPQAGANRAGVLFMVSGGWISRWTPPEHMIARFESLLDAGFAVFVVRHPSSPRYVIPEIVPEVRRAARFIKAHAGDYGVDPERLGVFGASAGGHLALLLGTTAEIGAQGGDENAARVAAVVAYYPPVDVRDFVRAPSANEPDGPGRYFPALVFDPDLAPSVSPILHVTGDDAPALLVHGDRDRIVPISHSRRAHDAFNKHEVATRLVVIEGAGHGFRGEAGRRANEAMVEWFKTHLLKKP